MRFCILPMTIDERCVGRFLEVEMQIRLQQWTESDFHRGV